MRHESKPMLIRIDHIVYQIMKVFTWISGGAVVAVMLLAFADVVSTKFFNRAIPSATEMITYMNVLIVLPTLGYIQLDTGHINVELFSKIPAAGKKAIRLFSNLLGLAISAMLGWFALKQTGVYIVKGTLSSVSALTKGAFVIWPFAAVFAFGLFAFSVAIIWSFVREFTGLEIVNNPMEMGPYEGEPDKESEEGV